MVTYNGKSIYEGNICDGNPYRREYLDSVEELCRRKMEESFEKRDGFMKDIATRSDEYREQFVRMIGQPQEHYPKELPEAEMKFAGEDDFCKMYHLQVETMPGFRFYGLFMVPHGVHSAPLVIAQHGGGSTPEICSELLGTSNYNFFTKRALERGMAVFAPQLLLWNFDIDTGEGMYRIDLPYKRSEIDKKLKQAGLSITGLEVYCLRRSIDYISSLDFIDENRIAMMGLSYGGYFSMYTAAADVRIKSIYAAGFFNDRTKIAFDDWMYLNSANTFCDAEVAALCAPRRLFVDVGRDDKVFDYAPSVAEAQRAKEYYKRFNADDRFVYNLWNGGHRFDESERIFDLFFDGI